MFEASEVFKVVIARLQSLVELFDVESQKGNQAFVKMKEDGHQDFYLAEISFIVTHSSKWQ